MKNNIKIPTCYIINSEALGDTIAVASVLKYGIERFHQDGKYYVMTLPQFKFLFKFLPEGKWKNFRERFAFSEPYTLKYLNKMSPTPNVDMLNLALTNHLIDYVSLNLFGRLFENINYVSHLERNHDISKFGDINWYKAIIIPVTFRSELRSFQSNVLRKVCDHIKEKQFIPVLVGSNISITTETKYPTYCINLDNFKDCLNLIDKTSLLDLLNIISESHAVMGIDCGILHLAGMTYTKIIAGYTNVNPDIRLPRRENRLGFRCYIVEPSSNCRYCQSDELTILNHDYTYCPKNNPKCSKSLTAEKWIAAFDESLEDD